MEIHDFLPWEPGQYAQWRQEHGHVLAALRASVPGIADEASHEIFREMPEFARPHDPRYANTVLLAVRQLMGQFVELMHDPGTPMVPIMDFAYGMGYGEGAEGRSLESLQKAVRLGARVAIRRLTQVADRTDPDLPSGVYGGITAGIFPYLEVVLGAAARGHAHAVEKAAQDPETHRRKLLALFSGEQPIRPQELREMARKAGWALPRTVAAVALHAAFLEDRRWPHPAGLASDVLVGLAAEQPFLVVPDPEGPGRRHMLEAALRGRTAVLGPPVDPAEIGTSLHWAREGLALAGRGVLPADRLVVVLDHLPTLLIQRHQDLVTQVGVLRLKPLMKARQGQRRHLAETLLAYLECGFNATQVAGRLGLHPQTVRYRLRQLKDLFGDSVYDPDQHLELQMVLRAWLAASNPPKSKSTAPPSLSATA